MYDTDFIVHMRHIDNMRKVKFRIELIHQSPALERYRLTGGEKQMILQKKIERQHSWKNWQVIDVNFEIKHISHDTINMLHHIYKIIDQKRFGRQMITYRLPADRNKWEMEE